MNWAHLEEFQPEINAAYASNCTVSHLEDKKQVHLTMRTRSTLGVNKNQFVWWAHVCFVLESTSCDEFKMLQADGPFNFQERIIDLDLIWKDALRIFLNKHSRKQKTVRNSRLRFDLLRN
jgi:hypothetical protein